MALAEWSSLVEIVSAMKNRIPRSLEVVKIRCVAPDDDEDDNEDDDEGIRITNREAYFLTCTIDKDTFNRLISVMDGLNFRLVNESGHDLLEALRAASGIVS